jgi:hypothetical protein
MEEARCGGVFLAFGEKIGFLAEEDFFHAQGKESVI